MITWTSEYEGHVNLANVEFTTLVGRRSRNDFSKEAHTCDLHHGERVVLERDNDRRVRVWVPRLDVLAWVWQRATDGTRLIKWSGDDEEDNHVVLRVTAPRTTSLAGKMWHRSVTFTEGQLLLGTSHESTDGARSVVLPSSNTEVRIMGSDVEPLAWPLHLLTSHAEGRIPETNLACLNDALEALREEGRRSPLTSQAGPNSQELDVSKGILHGRIFNEEIMRRDGIWRDLVDPELCLLDRRISSVQNNDMVIDGGSEIGSLEWQAAEVDVDVDGSVRWASWVNHLDNHSHARLLKALASLFELALPDMQSVCGHCLSGRRLQVVVRAYEQSLGCENAAPYRIAEWHTDGRPCEHIIATAACYIHIGTGLQGGSVEFAGRGDMWLDDPEATLTLHPKAGSMIVFNNAVLRHRVDLLLGSGLRRMVAFHLVDPEHRQLPAASQLPRQLRYQCVEETFHALLPIGLPARVLLLVARFASDGISVNDAVDIRNAERCNRLRPRPGSPRGLSRRTTGIWPMETTGIWEFTTTGWGHMEIDLHDMPEILTPETASLPPETANRLETASPPPYSPPPYSPTDWQPEMPETPETVSPPPEIASPPHTRDS